MQKEHRLINDNIYQHIEYTKLEDIFLQTKIVNRLVYITQNALAYFAFPSINTKRYIHSIGTMHLCSHMLKNSLVNCDINTSELFLDNIIDSVNQIIKDNNLNISIDNIDFLDDKSLHEFIIPTKSKKHHNIYILVLQALRFCGLLHDVGHFPFSHQIEYALGKLYTSLQNKNSYTQKEKEFMDFYSSITNNGKVVLHEAIGKELVDLLFAYELKDTFEDDYKSDYLKLLHILCKNIFLDKKDKYFSYKVLHKFVDSTVDADRMDYINRDMLSSGYISGAVDLIRIAKRAILIMYKNKFVLSFYDEGLLDIEHMLEMRFNLYKKIIYNHKIAKSDALLENVVMFLSNDYLNNNNEKDKKIFESISMLWKFLAIKDNEKKLDIISQLDENWLISLFKKEYFTIKYKENQNIKDKKYLKSFEEVLFGKHFYKSMWKNLNDFYNELEFTETQRYKFRESFGNVNESKMQELEKDLTRLIEKWQEKDENYFFSYQIVSLSTGISKKFSLYDGENLVSIDQISTLRKRLKQSMLNTVPFFLYSNMKSINNEMKIDIKDILSNYIK